MRRRNPQDGFGVSVPRNILWMGCGKHTASMHVDSITHMHKRLGVGTSNASSISVIVTSPGSFDKFPIRKRNQIWYELCSGTGVPGASKKSRKANSLFAMVAVPVEAARNGAIYNVPKATSSTSSSSVVSPVPPPTRRCPPPRQLQD